MFEISDIGFVLSLCWHVKGHSILAVCYSNHTDAVQNRGFNQAWQTSSIVVHLHVCVEGTAGKLHCSPSPKSQGVNLRRPPSAVVHAHGDFSCWWRIITGHGFLVQTAHSSSSCLRRQRGRMWALEHVLFLPCEAAVPAPLDSSYMGSQCSCATMRTE